MFSIEQRIKMPVLPRNEIYFIILLLVSSRTFVNTDLIINLDPIVGINDSELDNCNLRTDPTDFTDRVQNVLTGIHVLAIDQINEALMDFRLHCYFQASWINPNLTVKLIAKENPTVFMMPHKLSECMWKPDIYFPNTVDIKTFKDMVPNRSFKYYKEENKILREERFIFRISCPMKFSMYPFDTQHCIFKISLMGNTNDMVTLLWDTSLENGGFVFHEKMHPLQFHISKPTLGSHIDDFGNGVKYAELRANITFYRRLTGSLLNFYIPSTLVVVLSWISFYIDVEAAPARVTLSITALLTISTQMIQARGSLPPVQYITCMDVWLFFCMSLVFTSFIEYSIAYSYRNHSKNQARVQKPRSNIVKITNQKPEAWPLENQMVKGLAFKSPEKLDKISRWIFPLVMCIFSVVYWSFILLNTEIKFSSD